MVSLGNTTQLAMITLTQYVLCITVKKTCRFILTCKDRHSQHI